MKIAKMSVFLMAIGLLIAACSKQADYLHESRAEKDARMKWWRDAKFGLFIHWGLYAVPAGQYKDQTNHAEWIQETADIPVEEYEKYALQFNPVKFNPEEWVKLAKQAGMKYLVITSKHHDGFCLWDSKVSDYDVVDRTPFKRDILGELSQACKKYGVRFSTYYSIMDWHHPDAQGKNYPDYNYGKGPNPNFPRYVGQYMKPQLKELIENYGPLGVLWFDGEWIKEWTEEQGRELYNYVRNLQPDIIINNRISKARKGMAGMNAYENAVGDFGTPEQTILQDTAQMDWESCMTMNDHWGYNKFDKNFKSTTVLIHNLVDIVAKGGNYLLNVGPTAEGTFPEESIQRLKEIGEWMAKNQQAIYGTRRFKVYKEQDWLRYTAKPDSNLVYAIALRWPGEKLSLKYVKPSDGAQIRLVGCNAALKWEWDPREGLLIQIPKELQKEKNRPCRHAYVFRIPGVAADVVPAPVVKINGKEVNKEFLFIDSVAVDLECENDQATVYYNLKDADPQRAFEQPIILKESAILKAYAAVPGKVNSLPTTVLFRKITAFQDILLANPPSPKYARDKLILGDRERGSNDFRDGKWLGFEGEDFDAIIDLGDKKTVRKVVLGCLQNIGSWIWFPEDVTIFSSDDGKDFRFITKIIPPVSERQEGAFTEDVVLTFQPVKTRYLRVVAHNRGVCPPWHAGAGGKAWVFVDELMIQ